MTEKRTYTEELFELRVAVAAVPEIKEDVKELVRSIKGNNGNVGLIARMANVERVTVAHKEELECFKESYLKEREEIINLIDKRFDKLAQYIEDFKQQGQDHQDELEKMNVGEEYQRKRDFRTFIYGILLGTAPKAIEVIIGLFK